MATIKDYYRLTKPGIIYGNLIAGIGGFFIAAQGSFHIITFIATMIGLGFIIGSACVFNNILDRFIDAKMPRTNRNKNFVTSWCKKTITNGQFKIVHFFMKKI
jgi:protoheme IX farnesyltransferase